MSDKGSKNTKNLLFFSVAMMVVTTIMFVANYRSTPAFELNGPAAGTRKLFTSGDDLVAVSRTNEVYIWDWNKLSSEPKKGSVQAGDVTWMQPGRLVWTPVTKQDTLIVTDLKGMKEYKRIPLADGWQCKILQTSRNGKFTVIGLVDKNRINSQRRLRIGLVDSGFERVEMVVTIAATAGDFGLGNVAVSEDGAFVAVVGSNNGGWVVVADVERKKVLWEKSLQETTKIDEVTFSPDGKMLYVGGYGRDVHGFETITGEIVHKWPVGASRLEMQEGQQKNIVAIDVSADSNLVATVGTYTKVYIRDAITGRMACEKRVRHTTVADFAFSPDSSQFATVGAIEQLKIEIQKIPKVHQKDSIVLKYNVTKSISLKWSKRYIVKQP